MQKKILFFTAYFKHYLKKYLFVILLGIIFGSITVTNSKQIYQFYLTLTSSQINTGQEGIYTLSTLPSDISKLISYGFTTITENQRAVLSPLIENLTIENNNLTFIFTFKNNLFWQNGKKFDTSDIELDIPHIKINIISPTIIKLTAEDSYSPLLSTLSKPLFLKDTLIGLGNYKVKNISYQDGHIKLLQLISIDDNQQDVIYHFYSNSNDLYTAFKLGEVDQIYAKYLDNQLDGWQKTKISPSVSSTEYLGLFLNTTKFSSKQSRQAIAYATPKSDDNSKRCLGPISPVSWAYNPQIKQYNFNPTRAKELFEKGSLDKIDLIVTDRQLLTQAEVIKKSWENILNIKVNLTISTGQINFSDYDALLTYSQIPIDPDQYTLWHSTQSSTNITHLNNSRVDKLLEEGRQIHDQVERKKVYYDFQKFLLEESPTVFLEYPTTYVISRIK